MQIKQTSRYITQFSAALTIAISLYSLNWPFSAADISFLLWAVSPYMLLAMLIHLVSNKTAITSAFIITILTCTTGIGTLINIVFISKEPQVALAFSVIPLWQWGALIVLAIPLTLLNVIKNSKQPPHH